MTIIIFGTIFIKNIKMSLNPLNKDYIGTFYENKEKL